MGNKPLVGVAASRRGPRVAQLPIPADAELQKSFVPVYKVVVVGDDGVGKTALISRYVEGGRLVRIDQSLPAQYLLKSLRITRNGAVSQAQLQVWDSCEIPSKESTSRFIFQNASIYLVVFSMRLRSTFESLLSWIQLIRRFDASAAIIVIGGHSSSDAPIDAGDDDATPAAVAEKFCAKHSVHFIEYTERDSAFPTALFDEALRRITGDRHYQVQHLAKIPQYEPF